jgi:hypothetical protein
MGLDIIKPHHWTIIIPLHYRYPWYLLGCYFIAVLVKQANDSLKLYCVGYVRDPGTEVRTTYIWPKNIVLKHEELAPCFNLYIPYCSDTLNFGKPDSRRQWYNIRFLLWYLFSL